MIDTIILIAIGAFIGWNFPQPGYAKAIQATVVSYITKK